MSDGNVRQGSGGFSFASVIFSMMTVAGGVVLALVGLTLAKLQGQSMFYGAFGVGGLVGGFLAGRASKGVTIVEPAIGALLTVGAFVAMIAVTPVGELLWNIGKDDALRIGGIAGGATLVGAIVGAVLSEKLLGAATRSAFPWILYVAFAVVGGCFLAYGATLAFMLRDTTIDAGGTTGDDVAFHSGSIALMVGIAVGCVLAGLTAGAAARTRVLAASFLGGALGVFGFFQLVTRVAGGVHSNEEMTGMIVLAVGGGIAALIGSALGWGAVGRRHAG